MSRKFVAARRTPLMEPHTIYRLPSYPPATASKEGEELFSRVTLVLKLETDGWPVGLARSLEFSGLGLSVFWHVRTGFRFGLFQSLIVYKIESYHLQFREGNCIFLMKLLA